MSKTRRIILVSVAILGLGLWFGIKFLMPVRQPAAENNFPRVAHVIDNSADDELVRRIKIRLLQDMVWSEEGADWRLRLNSFALKTQGHTLSACESYRQVILRLVAADVIIDGESPQLTVTAECHEQNEELTLPLLSFSHIQQQVKKQTEWTAVGAHYMAQRLDEEWFYEWDLRELELVPRNHAPAILIDSIEIHAVRPGAGVLTLTQ